MAEYKCASNDDNPDIAFNSVFSLPACRCTQRVSNDAVCAAQKEKSLPWIKPFLHSHISRFHQHTFARLLYLFILHTHEHTQWIKIQHIHSAVNPL